MLTSAVLNARGFDAAEFEKAFTAADFDRCRELVENGDTYDAVLARARLALRERRYVEIIGALSEVPKASAENRVARDVLLGAALGLTRDYVAGTRLIERALNELSPQSAWYYDALHYKALIAWMRQDHREAENAAAAELRSATSNSRARAHILLSWVALRVARSCAKSTSCKRSTSSTLPRTPTNTFGRTRSSHSALLCRELPLREVADRVRSIFEGLPWTKGLQLEHFQVTRFLAAIDELDGNELAAFAGFRKAARLAPSNHWSVLCFLDRALLARNTGEFAFATEQVQEAHEIAQSVSWNEVSGEERSALLVLAELFAHDDPAVAEQYLARFRTLTTSVIPILSYGTDPRVKGFEAYSQGVSWLRLGDVDEGKAALTEAWSIFEDFNYAWRAALCALALYDLTHDRKWVQRAARKIDPWPHSWIARRGAAATNTSVLRLDRIPPAKRQVLELVRAGRRNAEIANVLGRSPNTVRNQLSQLFQTFNVKSRAELVAALAKPTAPVTMLRDKRRYN